MSDSGIPVEMRDINLKLPSGWYALCVPMRLVLAWVVSRAATRRSQVGIAVMLLFVAWGLYRKASLGRNWKDYTRPVMALVAAASILLFDAQRTQLAGAILAADALIGRSLFHITAR